jgi:hypothetical protein
VPISDIANERGRQLRRPRGHYTAPLFGSFENVDRDQDDVVLADVAVVVRRTAGRRRRIAGVQYLLAAVGEANFVCSCMK